MSARAYDVVRVGIVGAGIAGASLAWRLACEHAGVRVHLFSGESQGVSDATELSGGLFRGFELDPLSCQEASASLREMLASPVLRKWAGYTEVGSLYLVPDGPPSRELTDTVHAAAPGSLRLMDVHEVSARYGLRGLPPRTVAVHERRAGFVSPARLRSALVADAVRRGVVLEPGTVTDVTDGPGCRLADGRTVGCDAVVVAAGRWTGSVLSASGLPRWPLRTKRIQYGVYPYRGSALPAFIDETSGLYGRGTPDGDVLLGVPDHRWDLAAEDQVPDGELAARVVAAAATRFVPGRLGPPQRLVVGADSYHPQPGLRLRRVTDAVYTFAGGSGGSAKTALAAARSAATMLTAGAHWSGDGPDHQSRAEPNRIGGSDQPMSNLAVT
jgi:glycine/D-amino acid oxidase-like deaminating enzyme